MSELETKSEAAFLAILELAKAHITARNADPKVKKLDFKNGFEIGVTIAVPVPCPGDIGMKVNFIAL